MRTAAGTIVIARLWRSKDGSTCQTSSSQRMTSISAATQTSRPGSTNGSGRSSTASTSEKMRSPDLVEWELVGPIAGGATEPLGYMWECPDLVRLDARDVLVTRDGHRVLTGALERSADEVEGLMARMETR